jgi:polysaccharide export outer membrane protein
MIKNNFLRLLTAFTFLFFLWGCENTKQLAYFQDLTDTINAQSVQMYPYKPLRLQVDDQVQITISSTSPESSQFFNLQAAAISATASAASTGSNQAMINVYTVSSKGDITMPVFGDVHVLGMTTEELKDHISKLLLPYLKDGIVSVRLVNFKVTVIGDVGRASVVPVNGERINLLEAIGACGDLTVFGKRTNVRVLRKNGDSITVEHLNFTSSSIFNSPYFQLRQNDIVYVEPVSNKALRNETFLIMVPVLASISTILINLLVRLR